MPVNSLFPNFIRFSYTSEFGAPHSQTIPMNSIEPDISILGTPYSAVGNGLDRRDLLVWAEQFANAAKGMLHTSQSYTEFTAFSLASPTAPPQPIYSAPLNVTGTLTSQYVIWRKATQRTMTFRTSNFGKFQLVFLDVPVFSFDRQSSAQLLADANISGLISFVRQGYIRGRDGSVPETPLQLSQTLNEKLRRSYGML